MGRLLNYNTLLTVYKMMMNIYVNPTLIGHIYKQYRLDILQAEGTKHKSSNDQTQFFRRDIVSFRRL